MNKTYTLITGASGGIGKELANVAARDGHNVVLVARNKEKLNEHARYLSEHFNVLTEVIALDLSDREAPRTLHRRLHQKDIDVDILINNAGFGDYGRFSESDILTQLSMIALNVRTLTEITHLFLPSITKNKGHIMNVASVAGFVPGPLMSVYFATKAYVLSFSEALSEELRGSGVSVTCLAPGSTKSGFGKNARANSTHPTRTSRVTALQVATYGWRSMMNGKTLAIHGLSNRLFIFFRMLLPRHVVTRIVHRLQR